MIFARLKAQAHDELVCDFAESYHVLDIDSLPIRTAAILAAGLGENSRVKTKISGQKVTFEQSLLAMIFDGINWLVWSKTQDGAKNKNRPVPILQSISDKDEQAEKLDGFNSPETYEAAMAKAKERCLNG